ncbi:hypothetical protein [Listeria booriae]|uniref:Uncharacterized protein n=2 Tax=Listeria booriae TaxID=1552123 RepID=A0A7X0WGL6_9LIST|nr:hypothetical protein [Listeria booriae]MBC1333450.1 hypothetical protein [Listeria booriae]MBC2373617.1 hypothetical protein [Listeria booriae]MBC2388756.1 hypothetical protein [Listeria booriae]
MRRKTSTQTHIGNNKVFYSVAILILVTLFFSFAGNVIFPDSTPIRQDKVGKTQNMMTQKVTLLDWKYAPNSKEMLVVFGKSPIDDGSPIFQKVTSYAGKSKTSRRYKTEIVYDTDMIYVVRVKNVPSNYGHIYVSIKEKEITDDDAIYFSTGMYGLQEIFFYSDYRRVETVPSIQVAATLTYEQSNIDYQEKSVRKNINKEKKNIQQFQTDIKKLQENTEKLQAGLELQTELEKENTRSSMQSFAQTIEQRKQKITESEKLIGEYEEKVVALNKQKQALK